MEATNQGVETDSHVEGRPVVESGEQFTAYVNPLVQQSPMAGTSFHSLREGHTSPIEFGVTRPSFDNPPPGEDEYRRI